MTSSSSQKDPTVSFDTDMLDFSKGADAIGLLPAVVVHATTGQTLMVAWCNQEAVDHTLATGHVTFFSRSRQALWTKGETSGNTLLLQSIVADCDNDTLLIGALPTGPVCHTGTDTCFENHPTTDAPDAPANSPSSASAPEHFLQQLEKIIASRHRNAQNAGENNDEKSYTAALFAKGIARIAQKVGEEGVEVALAGVQEDRENLKNESADLLYHLLVLLRANNLPLQDVLAELQARHRQ